MLRDELEASIIKIREMLTSHDFQNQIANLRRRSEMQYRKKKEDGKPVVESALVLKLFADAMVWHETSTNQDRKVLNILDLDSLFDFNFWKEFITDHNSTTDLRKSHTKTRKVSDAIAFTLQQLPKILNLLDREDLQFLAKKNGIKKSKASTLYLLLPEDDEKSASPTRISEAMIGIEAIYSVHAKIHDKNERDIFVVSCDSGSDKKFQLLGDVKVLDSVKETFFGIWDKIKFHKNDKITAMNDNMFQTLDVIERLNQMQEDGHLEASECEQLRRQCLEGIHNLVKAKAIIPELENIPQDEPRKLFSSQPKRLSAPASSSDKKKKKKKNKKRKIKPKNKIDDSDE